MSETQTSYIVKEALKPKIQEEKWRSLFEIASQEKRKEKKMKNPLSQHKL